METAEGVDPASAEVDDRTMSKPRRYPNSCLDLAELFLISDTKLRDRTQELADHIADQIESWIARESEMEPRNDD